MSEVTDCEVALEFFYRLKLGSNMAYRLPAPWGCFIVPWAQILICNDIQNLVTGICDGPVLSYGTMKHPKGAGS